MRGLITRRSVLAGIAACTVLRPARAQPHRMSAREAHDAAQRGEVLLLDIRTPAEWIETGIATSAHPVSMHQSSFLAKLDRLTAGDMSKPVALICAVGRRSNALQGILTRMGYTQVIDVAEGMMGGSNGPGWIKSGLPVKPFRPD